MHSRAAEIVSIGDGSDRKILLTPSRRRSANEFKSTPPMLNSPKRVESLRASEMKDFVLLLGLKDDSEKPSINTGPD
jgi:hypothetical protein